MSAPPLRSPFSRSALRAPGGRGEGRGGSGGSHVVVSLCVSPSVLRWFGGGGGGEGGGGVGGREVGGERRYCRHRRRRRGGRLRATPPCAQRSVSPAEAARPQQPRKSVRACSLSPCSGGAGAGSPGFCVSASAGAARGWEADGACGVPGKAAAWGPLAQCRGRGAGRGCAPGAGGSRLSRFLPSPTPQPRGAGGSGGTTGLAGFGALGVRDRAVGSPGSWIRKVGRNWVGPETRASWKWAKRNEWVYENKRGNCRGPEGVQEKLAVDRCGYETNSDLGSTC